MLENEFVELSHGDSAFDQRVEKHKNSKESETTLRKEIAGGGALTEHRFEELEIKLVEIIASLGLSEEQRKDVLAVLDDSDFQDILLAIDGDGELKALGYDGCNELNKRLLFHTMKNIIYMPFPKYKHFVYWLGSKSYVLAEDRVFASKELYDSAQRAMEQKKRKRTGIQVAQIDANSFFEKTAPYR
ncbi:MAG: hypothetical protein AAF351_12010 [Pseudomonadota bacterium]